MFITLTIVLKNTNKSVPVLVNVSRIDFISGDPDGHTIIMSSGSTTTVKESMAEVVNSISKLNSNLIQVKTIGNLGPVTNR